MGVVVGLFAVVMGIAIAVVWTMDSASGRGCDSQDGSLWAREADSGSLMVAHWAEMFGTAIDLVPSGLLVVVGARLGCSLILLGLGALVYTSRDSLGWALAKRERVAYAVPMVIGLAGSLLAAMALLASA